MYSLVGSSVSWLHANLQVLSLCHCSILNQFPLKKMIKKKEEKAEKNSGDIHEHTNFILVVFFFWVLRKPQKIHPSFCVHMNGKVKQSSEKSKKKEKKRRSLRFYQWQKIHIVFWWILFQSVHQLVLGDDRCFNELLH